MELAIVTVFINFCFLTQNVRGEIVVVVFVTDLIVWKTQWIIIWETKGFSEKREATSPREMFPLASSQSDHSVVSIDSCNEATTQRKWARDLHHDNTVSYLQRTGPYGSVRPYVPY